MTPQEELADIYEVLRALAQNSGISVDEIHRRADLKRREKGGFEAGYELVATGGVKAPGAAEYRSLPYIKSKFEEETATIAIPLVPPEGRSAVDQFTIVIGNVRLRVALAYREDRVELKLEADREFVEDRQLKLFDE